MEMPILKSWIHSLIIDAVVMPFVDPGKLDIKIVSDEYLVPSEDARRALAQGVLTVSLSITGGDKDSNVSGGVITLKLCKLFQVSFISRKLYELKFFTKPNLI